MNSVAKLVSSTDIETVTSDGRINDKQLATVARLGKLLRKQETTLRGTIAQLAAIGYGVDCVARNTGETFKFSEIELTFLRLK